MRFLALSLLVACAAPRPGLLSVTSRWSAPEVTTIRGWSRTRGDWIERRPTRPGEYRPIAPRALRPRPMVLSRFAAYTAPEQALDDRAAATVVAMVIRPAWPRMVRVGGAWLR